VERQIEHAATFRGLHTGGDPLILFNIWDPGSARVVAAAGAQAIATGSWSVAAAYGYRDGQNLPFELAIENLKRIVASVELPVSIDLEAGYGDSLDELGASVTAVVDAGAVGINMEDLIVGSKDLYTIDEQSRRIQAVRTTASERGVPLFINARTDCFFRGDPSERHDELLDEALQRGRAYAEAGADGFFVPGLVREDLIERVCSASPLPVNTMVLPALPPPARLAELGVARISYGPGPYSQAFGALRDAAQQAFTLGSEAVITDWRLLFGN
jgi:2-methylisocitrate lyase-like PEP mutase family enzyme